MTVVRVNHGFINEVQTVSQMFFPNERFFSCEVGAGSGTAQGGDGMYAVTELGADGVRASVYANGQMLSDYTYPFSKDTAYLGKRRMMMLAFYHAMQIAVPVYTPWGALTGIRPSKLAREWLNDGLCDDGVVKRLVDPFCVSEQKARLALRVAHAEKALTERIFRISENAVGIYVSVPFCPSRCLYCSFNTSHKPAEVDSMRRYIDCLIKECAKKAEDIKSMGGAVSSIYIGGGTPTVLPGDLLEKMLDALGQAFGGGHFEYTVEAGRPDTITAGKLKILRRYGVNRIAINAQTFNDKTLETIGRSHRASDFFRAFSLAREAGFDCINTDLIAGLPGETLDDMKRNMELLGGVSPENITIHTLAVKRASRLNEYMSDPSREAGYPLASAADPTAVGAMLDFCAKFCAGAGLLPYYLYRQKNMVGLFENVGYSLRGKECLYNIGMMAEVQTIFGIGAGAVSKFVSFGKITREFNEKNPEIYIERRNAE